jgi:SAM-dependent methyltransferase
MGIDIHTLNFLRYASQIKPLGHTITIGRQGVHIARRDCERLIGAPPGFVHQPYCESLLKEHFGANRVESLDYSDYEQPTHVVDMNQRIPVHLQGQFDTVFDGGCLEHIYNVPQALNNCSALLKPGGQILHVLPANNYCGHGFWQFSPELFFSLYSVANGYCETEVLIADLSKEDRWYLTHPPTNGARINVASDTPLYVLVRTVLSGPEFSHAHVQQSDYEYLWARPALPPPPTDQLADRKQAIKARLLTLAGGRGLLGLWHWFREKRSATKCRPGARRKDMRVVRIEALISGMPTQAKPDRAPGRTHQADEMSL